MCYYSIMLWTSPLRYLSKSPKYRENTVKKSCGFYAAALVYNLGKILFYAKSRRSRTTAPAKIIPAVAGTKEMLPGLGRSS